MSESPVSANRKAKENEIPYVYAGVRKLDGQPKVGDLECVALIRHYTKAPQRLTAQKFARRLPTQPYSLP